MFVDVRSGQRAALDEKCTGNTDIRKFHTPHIMCLLLSRFGQAKVWHRASDVLETQTKANFKHPV
jgi:hypothetical protein